MSYQSGNLYESKEAFTFRCYICNRLIRPDTDKITKDHVIPQTLFNDEKTNRPTIYVHDKCNSSDKSKEDNWFAKTILYKCILNPVARDRFTLFLDSAERSRKNHLDKLPKDISNEKLLKTILNSDYKKGLLDDGREKKYIEIVARGLIIRNSWFMRCNIKQVLSVHRPFLKKDQDNNFNSYIQSQFTDRLKECIYQFWNNDIRYAINPRENLMFIQFYEEQTYLVGFDYELPHIIHTRKSINSAKLTKIQKSTDDRNRIWQQSV